MRTSDLLGYNGWLVSCCMIFTEKYLGKSGPCKNRGYCERGKCVCPSQTHGNFHVLHGKYESNVFIHRYLSSIIYHRFLFFFPNLTKLPL